MIPRMRKRRVVVLGATGSIGQSAAKVADDLPDRMEIAGLSAHRNAAGLAAQANRFRPAALCLVDGFPGRRACAPTSTPATAPGCSSARTGLVELAATATDADLVLVAIVGTGGLRPALAAIEAGCDLAVASKEILVMAGETVMGAAAARGSASCPWTASTTRFSNASKAATPPPCAG